MFDGQTDDLPRTFLLGMIIVFDADIDVDDISRVAVPL